MSEPLTLDDILVSLQALADELGPGTHQHLVVMVGGGVMALHGLRLTTADVDSARRLEQELVAAAKRVEQARGLPLNWLNASALPWRPQTLREEDCEIVYEDPRLLVLAAPLREVFLMKLISLRSRDQADIPVLWPHSGFASPQEAVAFLYEQAYPGDEPDPHLADWLDGVLQGAPEQ